ncbi:3-oxo-Delta(4,5)-steroid 5-beta-reductase-like [Melia azedarach]|uniref:3-oxo-Delta(4,5)-steroid 5-beta-reductase-like n=1 Tax=Melia azedarach TaxID=155640 RepID=A0ACC1YIN2_MELAZ|nr:3-oxo-Delta(4,5)-steroid 5-beta-reductase-like [Melia azedarach]
MEQENSNPSVALIVGVTGMAGLSLAEALKKPSTPGGPWKVYGASRRPPPSWFPPSLIDHFISFDALDAINTAQKLSLLSGEVTHVFWVAFQLLESEEINVARNSTMLRNVLDVLTTPTTTPRSSRLLHVSLQTGTKHYMGPIFDPSLAGQLVRHEPPFREESPRLPYPNFYYALEDLVASYSKYLTYSVHRSSIIVGASSRSIHNLLLTLAVYAGVCKHQALPFRYPGNKYTLEHFCDMSDARVLAEQHIWAAVTDKAKNHAFNCTNGDVFTWKSVWKLLSKIFDVEFVPFDEKEQFDWVEMMKDKGEIWDEIVEKHGLYKTKMEEITCFDALKTVLNFEFQHVSSMNKSREFGFFGFADTMKSIQTWVQRLRDMKIIP